MASILIIDDSPSIRAFLVQALSGAGHEVTTAPDGRKGLATLQSRRFDLVITDIFMPEADGIETIRSARRAGILPRVIAISSKDSIMNLLPAAKMLGAMRTLQKPFTAPQLLEVVGAVLQLPPPVFATAGG
jgi:DNA-binding response OmpR family regulator